MVFCTACAKNVPGIRYADGPLSCNRCGKVLIFDNYSSEPTFVKNAAGGSQILGRIVQSIESENLSRQRLYDKAYDDLMFMKNGLGMGENVAIVNQAMEFYRIAVERNFTRGRRTEQVQAACLYIACRENRKPYLLIDFSNYLRINVYVLGAVFLQLCKVLNLTEHPICQKLLDPSIFIHKYTASLTGGKNKGIADCALTIIASMNRDWMQTGRRPSGLWGAALYISALLHGIECSKSKILQLVHVCEATLSKRLVEFENTESGSLTIEELNAKAEELKGSTQEQLNIPLKESSSKELLCQHKGTSAHPFGYGLCKDCYAYFIGFDGGSDPPAFQRAERKRMEESSTVDDTNPSKSLEKELNEQHVSRDERLQSPEPETLGAATNDSGYDELHGVADNISGADDESDNFSDIDDAEVDGYIHNKVEQDLKKIIWEFMNQEYIKEQEAKAAATAAAEKAREESFKNCPEDLEAAKKLEEAAVASVAKSRKERQQKRAAEARNLNPAQSASEAAHRMLLKKRLSSKINFDALEKLFGEQGEKKQRVESHTDNDDKLPHTVNNRKLDDMNKSGDSGLENEDEDENDAGGTYDADPFLEHEDEFYDDDADFL